MVPSPAAVYARAVRRRSPSTLLRWLHAAWLVVALLVVVVRVARADDREATYAIEAGREAEVLALFAPIALTGEVAPGWRLMDVQIESRVVRCLLVGPADAKATLSLDHPSRAPDAPRSKSFSLVSEGGAAGDPAVAALRARVIANDPGGFWRVRLPPAQKAAAEARRATVHPLRAWLTDGIVLLVALTALTFVLVWRELRGQPRWMAWSIVVVFVVGLALRLVISIDTALDVWPYSRLLPLARLTFEGPALAWVSRARGLTLPLTDVVFATNLAVAVLTPLAMFTHARPLLRDPRTALAAVAIFAFAPGHLRFSHSDTAFIPALMLSSLTFGLVHRAARDESRAFRIAALVVLPLLQLVTLATRPLNVLFLPLYYAQLFWLDDGRVPLARRVVVAAVTTAVGVGFFFSSGVAEPGQTVVRAADWGLPWRVARALVTPRWNTLLHPLVTPPGLLVLSIFGVVVLARRKERRRAWFLLGWAFLFFAGHAVVLPDVVEMQARYQLHLIVPVAMLAAIALFELYQRRRRVAVVAACYLGLSPLLHLRFERDVAFNDVREFDFVRSMRARVPEGCTVLEHVDGDQETRFSRIGLALDRGVVRQRFRVQPIGADRGDAVREEAQALLAEPPRCLVYYEGLSCKFDKRVDEPIARACRDVAAALPWVQLGAVRFPSRPYDGNLSRGLGPLDRELTLTLYERATAPR